VSGSRRTRRQARRTTVEAHSRGWMLAGVGSSEEAGKAVGADQLFVVGKAHTS
jgi:hypothetical protein